MNERFEEKYHNIEDYYWWHASRRDMIYRLAETLDKGAKILEIGCSGGALLQLLKNKGFEDLCGVDISQNAVAICKEKFLEDVHVMDAARLEFQDERFDAVITSDILEHISDDDHALAEWNRVLKPGGKLIVFVPAFAFLWSQHDVVNNHYKRYSKRELINLLESANFKIVRSSYWNFIMFFPSFLIRMAQRLFAGKKSMPCDQFYAVSPVTNKALINLLRWENSLLMKTGFPFGVSVFAVAVKRSGRAS